MLNQSRVEEVEGSDVEMSDPSEADIDDFSEADILRRVSEAPPTQGPRQPAQQQKQQQQRQRHPPRQQHSGPDPSTYADFQCLYPIYFDSSRTRAQGRRVRSNLATTNPLATTISRACESLGLPVVLEPTKTHPKDWANPGRAKVALKRSGKASPAHNKHHLYILVAQFLQKNPTTEDAPGLRFRLPGAPLPPVAAGEMWPRPAVPKGWKVGELLPYYSPAMTGGGVSENMLRDMMREMEGSGGMRGNMASFLGRLGTGMPGAASSLPAGGAEEKSKKDKKGKGKVKG